MPRTDLEADVHEFTHAVGLLLRRVRAASASYELSLTESAVMSRLFKEGPATTAELARAESVKPQSMGTTMAALEERGLVTRGAHPTDGRQRLLALTPQGVAMLQAAKTQRRTWLAEAAAQLGREERAILFAATAIMKRLVEL